MKLTVEITVQETITVAEVVDLIREIESITDSDDCSVVTVAGLVAVNDQPLKKLLPTTLKDFIKEATSHGDPS